MGYFLRTTAGMKGPIAVDRLRRMIDAGKLTEDNSVYDAEGKKHRIGDVLPPAAEVDDFDALLAGDALTIDPSVLTPEPPAPPPVAPMPPPVPQQPVYDEAAYAQAPVHAAPRRGAPRRGVGAGVRPGVRGPGRPVGRARGLVTVPGSKLHWATTCFTIYAVLIFLGSAFALVSGLTGFGGMENLDRTTSSIAGVAGALIGAAIGSCFLWLVSALKRRSHTARVIGVIFGVLWCLGPGIILGIPILIGLNDRRTLMEFHRDRY